MPFLLSLNRWYVRAYHHLTLANASTIPAEGPAILAPTHTSVLDPLLIQSTTRRRIYWLMAAEYMSIPLTGPFWRAAGIVPVHRNGRDSSATRTALRLLRDGELVGIFPEGRISPTPGERLPLSEGPARLAVRARVPLLPLLLTGGVTRHGPRHMLRPLLLPQSAALTFGPPLSPLNTGEQDLHQSLVTALSKNS